jgi:hypothetical protein
LSGSLAFRVAVVIFATIALLPGGVASQNVRHCYSQLLHSGNSLRIRSRRRGKPGHGRSQGKDHPCHGRLADSRWGRNILFDSGYHRGTFLKRVLLALDLSFHMVYFVLNPLYD